MVAITNIGLWGEEFAVEATPLENKKIISKSKDKKVIKEIKVTQRTKVSLEEKIKGIEADVFRILGKYKDTTVTIKTYEDFVSYIDACINNGVISIDTETNNTLNTFDCKLMGLCLYTPGQKNAYIPVSHVDRDGNKLQWQITEEQIKEQLERCADLKKIYQHASFDEEVIWTTCGIKLDAYWDVGVAAQMLDENERKNLKTQFKLHIDPEQDEYDIESLFQGLPYEIFDPDLFALYAATDAYETYKLYEYQKVELEKPENADVYKLFQEVEIPIIEVVFAMEMNGVELDTDYTKRVSEYYHHQSDLIQADIDVELNKLKPQIDAWRQTKEANIPTVNKKGGEGKTPSQQLADPPELGSPTQMAIVLYDVLKAPVVDKKTPRGTGSDILKVLGKDIPLCKLLIDKRGCDKMLSSFVDALPKAIQKDGKIHARFNSTGTKTGRFSSEKPNLQNIPSHAKEIRLMFKAPKGYLLCGSDYSGQEMRVLASLSEDKEMISAYEKGQDMYAKVASLIYKNDYEDNLEFRPGTGEKQPAGKDRRSKAKIACLGLNYGMSVNTLAESYNISLDDAQFIVDGYYGGLKGVKKYTDESQQMLKELGYVTDAWGRKRHIPEAMLPEYSITVKGSGCIFNPLLFSKPHQDAKTDALVTKYRNLLSKAKWKKEKYAIIEQAKSENVFIVNNSSKIGDAMRQCLNARVQGSSATMTKIAMLRAFKDPELTELGFKLLFTVHDEFAGIVPAENAERAGERLCEIMVDVAKIKCGNVPWKCDPYIVKHWYADEISSEVAKLFNEQGMDAVVERYPMINRKYLEQMCEETFDFNAHEDI